MKKTGFSLVEMMVAVSIFAMVALIATNAFLTADRISKKAQAMKTIIDNLHFALNDISFDLQQGGTYHCLKNLSELGWLDLGSISAQDCSPDTSDEGGPGIIFNSPKSGDNIKTIVYKVNNNRLWYASWDKGDSPSSIPFTSITVPNLDIQNLQFFVSGAASGGAPRVFFTVDGVAQLGQGDLMTPFQLQTVVSERI